MPSLYERIGAVHPTRPRIPVHAFQAICCEVARGAMTTTEAQTMIGTLTGEPLDALEAQELSDLLATIPTGTTTAKLLDQARRWVEIDQCLLLLEHAARSPADTRTRLGVVTR